MIEITEGSGAILNKMRDQINDNFDELDADVVALQGDVRSVTVGAPTAGAANTTTCTISVLDSAGAAVAGIHTLNVWVSDDADGNGLTATAASGTLTATAGSILTAVTAKKHVIANTSATGVLTLALVDSAKTQGERFCVANPTTGQIAVSAATITASYG